MKNLKYKIPILLLSAFIILSCEKFIEVDYQDREKLLVVHSFINPESSFLAVVSHSLSTFSNEDYEDITDALVIISSESSSDTLEYDNGFYTSVHTPVQNKEYTLTVEKQGFSSVSSTDIIPQNIEIISLDTTNGFHNGEVSLDFELKFTNEAGKDDYMVIELLQKEYWEGGNSDFWPAYISSEDPAAENDVNNNNSSDKILLTDKNFDGQEYTFRFYIPSYYPYTNTTYKINVYSCSKNYYNYMLTLDKYNQSSEDFFSQPVQIYSNIENGIGIFGAFSINEIEL